MNGTAIRVYTTTKVQLFIYNIQLFEQISYNQLLESEEKASKQNVDLCEAQFKFAN